MKLKALFFGSLLLLFRVSTMLAVPRVTGSTVVPTNEATHQQILSSTVQIVMYAKPAEPSNSEVGSQGLGTLVKFGNQAFLITHDHWSHLTAKLKEVEFLNADGDLLLAMDATAFRALIYYRDSGTMILQAPQNLIDAGVLLTNVKGDSRLDAGQVVWLARYSDEDTETSIEVAAGSIKGVEDQSIPARLQLQMLDGYGASPGDSGGGVWHNGKFIGNVWANGVQVINSESGAEHCNTSECRLVLVLAALLPDRCTVYGDNDFVDRRVEKP